MFTINNEKMAENTHGKKQNANLCNFIRFGGKKTPV
jgi:hypothetical protein